MDNCVVLISDKKYFPKLTKTLRQLRGRGRYRGMIFVIAGNDLKEKRDEIEERFPNTSVLDFDEVDTSQITRHLAGAEGLGGTEFTKTFQYNQFQVFRTFFKKFDKILYLDAGMRIFGPIKPIFSIDCSEKLIAHSERNAFPEYAYTLEGQFNFVDFPELLGKISNLVSLDSDYFQSTMMLFDSSIISENSFDDLVGMAEQFPNSKTNSQGILNLWALSKDLWTPLPHPLHDGIKIYDFWERAPRRLGPPLMVKYPKPALSRLKMEVRIAAKRILGSALPEHQKAKAGSKKQRFRRKNNALHPLLCREHR